MEEKVTMRLKKSFSNHQLVARLNLSSDHVRNCKETATFVKESNLWHINKDFYLKKFKELDKFREIFKKAKQVKLVKVLEKYPKLEVK